MKSVSVDGFDMSYAGHGDGEHYSIQTHADDVAAFIRAQTSNRWLWLVPWWIGLACHRSAESKLGRTYVSL
ncbi:MAG: hypothetical protein HOI95_07245 [Chromatiales bacterium]|jgi:hypothetical protein|nr:hypothetical protein [Chromatiales bacterium]